MSLRAKLALALGTLAALAAALVAVIGYQATADQLTSEISSSLNSYAQRLADPNGRLASQLCSAAAGYADDRGGGHDRGSNPLDDLPGATVRCLDASGDVLAQTGPRGASDHDDGTITVAVAVRGGKIELVRSTSEIHRILESLRTKYLLLVVGVTATAAFAGWVIASRATRPVTALTVVAEQIATSGRLDLDVPTSGRDEVGRLARSFASMLDALRRSRDQQQRLVQDAGHELRTPLTSLRTNIDTLRRHPEVAGVPRNQLLGDLDSELRELSTLTEELVTLAADPGSDEPETTIDFSGLVQRCVDRAHRRTGRTIITNLDPTQITGRERQLQRMIDNLLDNAAKFSPTDTTIEVLLRPDHLSVRDHGPGISVGDLPHVFERFYRATEARSAPGSGLGLSIVADIASQHGGVAKAANAPDGGAIITVAF